MLPVIILCTLVIIICLVNLMMQFSRQSQHEQLKSLLSKLLFDMHQTEKQQFDDLATKLQQLEVQTLTLLSKHHTQMIEKNHDAQMKNTDTVNHQIKTQMTDIREQLNHSFKYHADSLSKYVETLNSEVKSKLKQISEEVHKQLHEGFNKTTTTFTDVVKRLTIIDEAQKRIAELSNNVVDLQMIFQDKRSRGAFGEVQLSNLIENVIPKQHYAMQHVLSNQRRADCVLFLPDPTGHVVIDAKFPLESYQKLSSAQNETELKQIRAQFKLDIKKHITDIADRYIIKDETAEGAIMFIPAEAIFAEIHANYPEIVALSHQKKVWLASPNTLMAILTTAKAVLKDDATKKQVHLVQAHLNALAKDFQRFDKRMSNLAKHIQQANHDVDDVHISAKKITQRFNKIEQLEIENNTMPTLEEMES